MKYTVTVKLKNGTAKSERITDILRILDKHPQAKEIIINGRTVWKK